MMQVKKSGAIQREDWVWEIRVWAPFREKVQVEWRKDGKPVSDMQRDPDGYWSLKIEARPGDQYRMVLDEELTRPDPASRRQPEGVHGWSQLYPSEDFQWQDEKWVNPPLRDYLIYELHTGTFTPEGTFSAIIPRLDDLVDLGVTAIELMPVSPFPGTRNWGYDGVFPYAVQESYGGPDELKKLVNACHNKGLAVILDVVYNHLGPEGNYLHDFGPYFTDKYHTPWGKAINFDDAYCDHVRHFFLQTLPQWFEEYHFDALRLDAVHSIYDNGPVHILQAMRDIADRSEQKTGRRFYLIAESNQNDRRLVSGRDRGGYGLDGQWADDFHHALHSYVTGEKNGYYADFGGIKELEKAFHQPFVYDGKYSVYRKKQVGSLPAELPPWRFVTCIQNHDQTGNRMKGERLSQLVSFGIYKIAAGLLLVSPYTPLLFMGEEYGETQPFQYFVSHGDADLVEAVKKGRTKEFKTFSWQGEIPDPQATNTFHRSKIEWSRRNNDGHRLLLNYYKYLIRLRRSRIFEAFQKVKTSSDEINKMMILRSADSRYDRVMAIVNFKNERQIVKRFPEDPKHLLICSAESRWGGSEIFKNDEEADQIELPAESLTIFTEKIKHINE